MRTCVGKYKNSLVLVKVSSYIILVNIARGMTQGLLVSTKCMAGFTSEYLPLISYYLQVQKCTPGVIQKYFHEQCIHHVAQDQHMSYPQNFLKYKGLL